MTTISLCQDVVVVMRSSGIGYERHLRVGGTLLLDASGVTSFPMRQDIEFIVVPTKALVQRAVKDSQGKIDGLDQEDLEESVMLGAVLSLTEEPIETERLDRLFQRFYGRPVHMITLATDEGYDWLQDIRMRGKSSLAVVGQ